MNSFHDRLISAAKTRSAFCLGIDPTDDVLSIWGLESSPKGLEAFCGRILDLCGDQLAIVKPQSAYFERFGHVGIEQLKRLVDGFHARGSVVLIDAKRGDIGSTNEAYARTYFGADSYFQCDAITVSPYLGFDSLTPIFEAARASSAAVFVVVASSNSEGIGLQGAVMRGGQCIVDALVKRIAEFNASATQQVLGAVIGATRGDVSSKTIRGLRGAFVLCPGIGAQGASFEDVTTRLGEAKLIPTSARSVLSLGDDRVRFRQSLREHQDQAAKLWASRSPEPAR